MGYLQSRRRLSAPDQRLHLQLLGCLGDLALPLDDAPQRRLVPLVPVGLLLFGINTQVLLYVLLDGDPAVVDIDGRIEDIDFLEDSAVLLQNHANQRHGFAGLAGAEEDTCAWYQGHHEVRGLFAAILSRRKQLDLPHLLAARAAPAEEQKNDRRPAHGACVRNRLPLPAQEGEISHKAQDGAQGCAQGSTIFTAKSVT